MPRRDSEAPMRARIAADVERKDAILFGLNFRQVVILTTAGLVIYAAWAALAAIVAPLIFLAGAVPVAGLAFVLAVGRRDGMALDAWVLNAIRHRLAPHRLVPAETPIIPAPGWVQTRSGRGDKVPLPAPLRLPATGITGDGLIDLGPDGTTALVSACTVGFGLRSPGEQNGLVAGFGRWLNSLDAPVQILVRAERVDLNTLADRVHALSPGLPHPALEQAALSHVVFLEALADQRELLHRQVTIAVRDQRGPEYAIHRATETVRALSGCEVSARVLDGTDAAATIADCLDPGSSASMSGDGYR